MHFYSPNEGVALVLEHPDLLDVAKGRKGLGHELLGQAGGQAAAVHRAVGRTGLVVHLVERQRLGIGCNRQAGRGRLASGGHEAGGWHW